MDPAAVDSLLPPVVLVRGLPPAAVLDLRRAVFVGEQGVPAELELDGRDAAADHAVALGPGGAAVATGRLLDPDPRRAGEPGDTGAEPVGVIGRVAVAAAWRGRGLGLLVTAALLERARERGLAAVELHAQTRVAAFYGRQGYRVVGESDVEAGIEHVWMRRDLAPGLRRVLDRDAAALQDLIGTVWSEYPGCVLDVDAEEPWLRAPAAAHDPPPGGPRRAMWVIPAEPAGPESAERLLASIAVWVRRPDPGTAGAGAAPTAELKTLYVAAAARRRGLGATLVRRAEREARRWGIVDLGLWTDTRFTDAHRLYGRLGYVATGRSRDLHDLSATTEIEYRRTLPPDPDAPGEGNC
ncbi:GNAT family N-acetyltransferase [Frankia sp. AgB32]|nr:GNAT family N-acetyltransferase [Frankia sp. AgB32]